MLQIIEEPTRGGNTLNLMFTNEVSLMSRIEVNKSKYSDHNIIEVNTSYTTTENYRNQEKENTDDNIF